MTDSRPGPLNVKGDARSQKQKVACISCNNGWMSELQNLTKPILLPVLLGERKSLSQRKQKILATWATMFVMVYETTNPEYAATTDIQRRTFKQQMVPPQNWLIWCAPFSDDGCPAIHMGFATLKNHVGPLLLGDGTIHRAQITLCGGGKVCFLIFGAASDEAFQAFSQFVAVLAGRAGFVRIWPCGGSIIRTTDNRTSPLAWSDLRAFRDAVIACLTQAATRR